MATLATNSLQRGTGLALAALATAAAGGGDAMSCGSGMFLFVNNGGGSSITVTMAVPAARVWEPGVGLAAVTFAVLNGVHRLWGPVDAATFQDPTTGLCTITYSGVTTVTVAAVQLVQP